MGCHGINLVAGGNAPDLRGSPVIMDGESFHQVIKGSMLKDRGMPQFDDLSDAELAAVRHYIRNRAADLRSGR